MGIDRDQAHYRFVDDGKPPHAADVEIVAGVITEYGTEFKSGDRRVWDTSPDAEEFAPLAKRIENHVRGGTSVYRRRIIVVDDWTEVDEP